MQGHITSSIQKNVTKSTRVAKFFHWINSSSTNTSASFCQCASLSILGVIEFDFIFLTGVGQMLMEDQISWVLLQFCNIFFPAVKRQTQTKNLFRWHLNRHHLLNHIVVWHEPFPLFFLYKFSNIDFLYIDDSWKILL